MTDTTLPHREPRGSFEPRRWLLVDLGWDDLPDRVRNNPWARWHHDAGLVQSADATRWARQLRALLRAHPDARVSVVADAWRPDGVDLVLPWGTPPDDAARLSWHRRSAGCKDEGDALQGLRSLLGPEPEGLDLVGAEGQPRISWPRGVSDELVERWRDLVQAWAQAFRRRLRQVAESDEETDAVWSAAFAEAPAAPPTGVVPGAVRSAAGEDGIRFVRMAAASHGRSSESKSEDFTLKSSVAGGWALKVKLDRRAGAHPMPLFLHKVNQDAWWARNDGSLASVTLELELPKGLVLGRAGQAVLHDGAGPAIALRGAMAGRRPGQPSVLSWTLQADAMPGLASRVRRWQEPDRVLMELHDGGARPGGA